MDISAIIEPPGYTPKPSTPKSLYSVSAPPADEAAPANLLAQGDPVLSALKRTASQTLKGPAKKAREWVPKEDNLMIELQDQGVSWKEIALLLPGRTDVSCRKRYQTQLTSRDWSEDMECELMKEYNE